MIEFESEWDRPARIKVIGVGGGGGNAINRMITSKVSGVEFVSLNTDVQVLRTSLAPTKIQIGSRLTKGLGAGANPEMGRRAAEEDKDRIADALVGSDMVFITAGMGGGTGTGASPVVAEVAKATNALTVAVVTKPFAFEGKAKILLAEAGLKALQEHADTVIVIPNERLLTLNGESLTLLEAFLKADEVLRNAVAGISELITVPGLINLDFADVRTIMANMGGALMGIGVGTGEKKAVVAAETAITSPLLEDLTIDGAKGILINVTCGPDVTIMEINEAISMIQKRAHKDAHLIFGARIDEGLYNEVRITVIATGFDKITEEERLALAKEAAKEAVMKDRAIEGSSQRGTSLQDSSQRESRRPEEVPKGTHQDQIPREGSPGSPRSGLGGTLEGSGNVAPVETPALVMVAVESVAPKNQSEPAVIKPSVPAVETPIMPKESVRPSMAQPSTTQQPLINDWEVPAYVRRRTEIHLKGNDTAQ